MKQRPDQAQSRSYSDRFAVIVFACLIFGLSLASWMRYLNHPSEAVFPLFSRLDAYRDLLNYRTKMLHLDQGAAFVGNGYPIFNYLAPAAFVYRFLLRATDPVLRFKELVVGFFGLMLLTSVVVLIRRRLLRWENLLGLLALAVSFPILFVVYRGNLEGIGWIAITVALALFLRREYTAAAIVLGLAMSLKPFPAILLLLFIGRRHYRAAIVSVVVAALLVLRSMAVLGPGVLRAYHGLQPGVALYAQNYIWTFRSPVEQSYAHGILDVLKVLYLKCRWIQDGTPPADFDQVPTPTYFPLVDAVIALLLAGIMVWKLRRMPALNQVFGACIALALIPPSAADYTLCGLYLPTLFLGYYLATEVRSRRSEWSLRHVLLLVVPLAALMSPLNLLNLWTSPARLLLLLVLAFGVITLPLPLPELDRSPQVALAG